MNKRLLLTFFAALATSLVAIPALACIHAMSKSTTTAIAPTDLEAILAWDDGVEDLVIRIGYHSADGGPEKLAYVLPVRNAPSHYSVVDERVFEEMHDYVDLKRVYRPKSKSKSRSRSAGAAAAQESSTLQMLPAVAVGPFEIQPLKATGAAGLEALQTWMKENGFSPIPNEDAKYYVDRNWTFLAVKLTPEGKETSSGTIPALHVRFPSERAVLPLKLLKMNSPISVTTYLLTKKAVTREVREAIADKHQFESTGGRYNYVRAPAKMRGQLEIQHSSLPIDRAPGAVQTLLKEIGWPSKTEPALLVLHSGLFGDPRVDPSQWKEEMAIPPADEKLMGGEKETARPATDQPATDQPATDQPNDEAPDEDDGARPATLTNEDETEVDDQEPIDTNPSILSCSVSGGSGPSALLLMLALVFGRARRTSSRSRR